jgi:hypothetical protein
MTKQRTLALLGMLLLIAGSAFAQQRTRINDTRAKAMLLGRHRLSLQWISWDYFGTATVTERRGVLFLKGEQKGRGSSDLVRIDGRITSVDAKQFTFDGKVVMRISHINGGEPCEREGEMTFKITGKRKYWRMQEMDNPCDEATDYVDIYFK